MEKGTIIRIKDTRYSEVVEAGKEYMVVDPFDKNELGLRKPNGDGIFGGGKNCYYWRCSSLNYEIISNPPQQYEIY